MEKKSRECVLWLPVVPSAKLYDDYNLIDLPKPKKSSKKSKHAPQEISSKKKVFKKKTVEKQREVRGAIDFVFFKRIDPRFDGLSGKFNYDLFRKSYRFIEQQQDEEIKEMRDTMFNQEDETNKRSIQVFYLFRSVMIIFRLI